MRFWLTGLVCLFLAGCVTSTETPADSTAVQFTDVEICEKAKVLAQPVIEARYSGASDALTLADCRSVKVTQEAPNVWQLRLRFWEAPQMAGKPYITERLRITYSADEGEPWRIERLATGGR